MNRDQINSNPCFCIWENLMKILMLLSFIFLMCGVLFFYTANQIKISKNKKQEQYKIQLENEICNLQKNKDALIILENERKKELNKELLEFQEYRKKEIETYLKNQQQLAKQTINKANQSAQ